MRCVSTGLHFITVSTVVESAEIQLWAKTRIIKLHKNYTTVHPMWEMNLPRLNIVTKPLPFNCVTLLIVI